MEIEDRRTKSVGSKLKSAPWWQRLKKIKNIQFIACVFILAVALLLYSVVTKATKTATNSNGASVSSNVTCSDVETRLSSILSQIDGAGEVSVLITYSSELSSNGSTSTVSGSSASGASSSSATSSNDSSKISGVIVVASGAKDIGVLVKLQQAVVTALNVSANCVEVYAKK